MGALVVFMAHFRPWEVAFLEEWPLAQLWTDLGPLGFMANFFEWSLSRPLHLVPTALGLAVSGGSPWGIFLILGLVATAQFLGVVWALRTVSRSFWISGAVGLFIALHPLWPGGFLQRFLPAQTAGLALIITAGLVIRWLQRGRVRWIIWAAVVSVIGLCVYPGTAVATPLMALVIALAVQASWRRRIVAVIVVTATAALVTLYSLLIARLVLPGGGAAYESVTFAPATVGGPRELLTIVGSVLLVPGIVVSAGLLFVAVLGAVLALTGSIPHWAGWLIAGTAMVSPICALVFFGNAGWLQDVERIAYTTSLGLGIALLVWPMTSLGRRPRLEVVLAVVLVLLTLMGTVRGIQRWQPYIALQHQLFAEVAPAMAEAEGDEIVVVVDHSGTFGSEYTLPQSYMAAASQIMNGDRSGVWLCSLAEDPALFGAGVCDPKDTGEDLRHFSSFDVPNGSVDIYIGVPPSDD